MEKWRQIQRKNFTSFEKLAEFLLLDESSMALVARRNGFPLNLPLRLAKKIEKNNLKDPIFLQFVPLKEEEEQSPGYSLNPVGDEEAQKAPKFLQKYQSRVLLLPTSACAMNCRFCFRKHFPYETGVSELDNELALIQKDASIKEVILSGGDPLSLSNTALDNLVQKISAIGHVRRLRFHSRFPIGIPERIDDKFLEILKNARPQIWFLIHCNHPLELDDDVIAALKKVRDLGVPILSQTVLLNDVNDSIETLEMLFEKLVDQGFIPYYLHQLDKVQGSAHFNVPEDKGLFLMENLRSRLSGYALPRYVKEIAGENSKTPIA